MTTEESKSDKSSVNRLTIFKRGPSSVSKYQSEMETIQIGESPLVIGRSGSRNSRGHTGEEGGPVISREKKRLEKPFPLFELIKPVSRLDHRQP
ncbi:hypothetical protein TNIN_58341 [Trichonephila inaurata madagascariensis]|uniref:Uncharacterized protein n=1 Tax=Trichonephila inaurata madagascariensis TaxID=2747483 RepID=A0A8X6JRS0_9ARAC|nr:hypothetical protein TNIN_58341 [Trichonephila inaurata madagascariensis]